MRPEQVLIENYWAALYTNDNKKLKGLLDRKVQVTILDPKDPEGKPLRILNSRKELRLLAKGISSVIDAVEFTSRSYDFKESSISVSFEHRLVLNSKPTMHTSGFQEWTVKIDDNGKMLLDSLRVLEAPAKDKSVKEDPELKENCA